MADIFNVNLDRDGAYNVDGSWYGSAALSRPMPRAVFYNYGKMAVLAYITEEEYNLIVSNFSNYVEGQTVRLQGGDNRSLFIQFDWPLLDIPPVQPPGAAPGTTDANIATLQAQTTSLGQNLTPLFYEKSQRVNFIGPQLPKPEYGFFGKPIGNPVSGAPYYFIPGRSGRVHKLFYITTEAQKFLIDQDIYNDGLATNNYYGPYLIPIYESPDSGYSGAGGTDSNFSSQTGSWGDWASYMDNGGYDGGTRLQSPPRFSASGVYNGSLSSQGNMVAMQLNDGDFNFTVENRVLLAKPFHEGYFKTYFKDPMKDIFGANTQMPALTGVMPARYTDLPGNAIYYTDMQLYRMSGSNTWDNYSFINNFGQIVGYVLQCNNYLAALKNAENNNLAYYGADSFQVLTTQGFNNYQVGSALVTAFRNIGNMASLITAKNDAGQPYFGTANAVAEVLIENGLGYINNLSTNLYAAGVNFDDIGNTLYTDFITDQLRQITNAADLQTIQEVLQSSVPNIANPLDYTRIDRSSGLPNDSLFADFQAVGVDFANRAPNLVLTNGLEIANLIDSIQSNVALNVEALAGSDSLLDAATIDSLRTFLPIAANNEPITMLNIVGTPSGYQNVIMNEVNDGIAQLFATSYGPQIRDTFTEISRLSARLPLTTADESQSAATWDTQLENKKNEYYTLIDTIMADTTGNIPAIVNQINSNWDQFTANIYSEFKNYNKANITQGSFGDNTTILSFIQSMPGYAADQPNIATDYMLYGLTQDNVGGETARTVLDQGKNDLFLQQAGVTITGIL